MGLYNNKIMSLKVTHMVKTLKGHQNQQASLHLISTLIVIKKKKKKTWTDSLLMIMLNLTTLKKYDFLYT